MSAKVAHAAAPAGARGMVVQQTFTLAALADEDLSPAEMFVLTRVGDDRIAVADLLDICVPLSDNEVETIVRNMLERGLLTTAIG